MVRVTTWKSLAGIPPRQPDDVGHAGEHRVAGVRASVVDQGKDGRLLNQVPEGDGGAVFQPEARVAGHEGAEVLVDADRVPHGAHGVRRHGESRRAGEKPRRRKGVFAAFPRETTAYFQLGSIDVT